MYTAKILRRTADKQLKKLYVDIAYHLDGGAIPEATETKEFGIEASMADIARHAKREIKRLEQADANLATIIVGDIDLTGVEDVPPTAAELAKQEWFRDFGRLEALTRLQTLGALPADKVDRLNTLRAKVADGFKPAYIADM